MNKLDANRNELEVIKKMDKERIDEGNYLGVVKKLIQDKVLLRTVEEFI
jgi:hypothetical protein